MAAKLHSNIRRYVRHHLVHSVLRLSRVRLWARGAAASGMVVLVDEGQNIVFGQFPRIHAGLRVVNDDAVHPGPEETLRVADAEDEDRGYGYNKY